MKKYWILSFFCLFYFHQSFATHNRAGEITYKPIGANTYRIWVTTYTKESSCSADVCNLKIYFGDGDTAEVERINGSPCSGCGSSCDHCGESIGNDTKVNVYRVDHSYSGFGTFTIKVESPNRNAGVLNVPNSEFVPFYIQSDLVIAPGFGTNQSPTLNYPPIDNGCVGLPFLHNPGAVDAEGDSLVYSIVECSGADGDPIPGFSQPNLTPGCSAGSFEIDPNTGTLEWNSPICVGEYNLAILIEEYRTVNGYVLKMGSILRDMQVTITAPCPNSPPIIQEMASICAVAGEFIQDTVTATDPDPGDFITLTASGLPLNLTTSPAQFPNAYGYDLASGVFTWQTQCDHVQNTPYQMVFRAEDDHPDIPLVDFEDWSIQIIAPAVENLQASPVGNSVEISWNASVCTNASCYKVYRKIDSSTFTPSECETGLPATSSYELLATLSGWSNTSYTDEGLFPGNLYCYRIVACFSDGAESIVSDEACAELKKDVPIICQVTISETDISNGQDTIRWIKPTELDTAMFPGPYAYRVLRGEGFSGEPSVIYTSPSAASYHTLDTFFIDNLLNTQQQPYNYQVEILYNASQSAGFSSTATSIYLTSSPTDNRLPLSWKEFVPWNNTEYVIYKETSPGLFTSIATVSEPTYTDTGLANGVEYCYYIKSIGNFTSFQVDSILNKSQIHCAVPYDNVAPCTVDEFNLESNCPENENTLWWNNPNNQCADDVMGYRLYYTPKFGDSLQAIAEINRSEDTVFIQKNMLFPAGCYGVSAIDSNLNESHLSDTFCVDNCPIYELPNVFTPGTDGVNSLFEPFPYRHIAKIHLEVYNRWGEKVFETKDPDIKWDGRNMNSGKLLNDGVYYYLCTVFEIKLIGITSRELKGTIHIFKENASTF